MSEETDKKTPCPRCGHGTDAVKPSEGDLAEYQRSVLGGRPFVKTYEMFGGQIRVTLAGISAEESRHVGRLLLEGGSGATTHSRLLGVRLRMLAHVNEVQVGKDILAPVKRFDMAGWSEADIDVEYTARFGGMQEPVLRMVERSTLLFMELAPRLLEEMFDEDFWMGAGPV